MFVRLRKRESGKTQIQVIENVRRGGTVHQKIIRNYPVTASEKEIEQHRAIAESFVVETLNARQPVLAFQDPHEVYAPKAKKKPDSTPSDDVVKVRNIRHESSHNDGWEKIFGGVYDEMGLSGVLKTQRKEDDWNGLLRSLVIARLANPSSKRQTQRLMKDKLEDAYSLDTIYALLDHLEKNDQRVRAKVISSTQSLFPEPIDILFFDVTTLYFESVTPDDLKKFGFSKDCKFNEVQVVLALITTTGGLPVSFKLFPGNTSEGKTLITCVQELKKEFSINQVILAADRAMFSDDNLSMLEAEGVRYVVAAKLKALTRQKQSQILDSKNYGLVARGSKNIWVGEFPHGNRRLIVTLDRDRAEKDAADRQRLIDKLVKKAKDGKVAIGTLISNHGTKRFIKINGGSAELNQEKIDKAGEWDGLHGVITNDKNAPVNQILETYHGLWQIEESFRVQKHDLKMRPIYHWTPKRIQAHILLCFIAFAVGKQTLARLRRKGINFSLAEVVHQLSTVEQHRLYDISTQRRYLLPSAMSRIHESIFSALQIKRPTETVNV
jgi:transposase